MKPQLIFTKELFIEIVDALDKQFKHDEFYVSTLEVLHHSIMIAKYKNDNITDMLLKLLKTAFSIKNRKFNDIDYFIYELDFGRKFKIGCAIDENKKPIDMSCAGALYDYLIR